MTQRPHWTVRQDGDWTILHVYAGGVQTTSSLTREEAQRLSAQLAQPSAERTEQPLAGHVYRQRSDGTVWSFVARWKHPSHQPYHKGWDGEYAIVQEYGNFSNQPRLVLLADWDDQFELAWDPVKVCQFCGFTRMRPCLERQTCANLTDYRLEPEEPGEPEESR